ncbi:MAG: class I SAM-dependent methyltransferase [Planctomycetota bacterium]|nr:class I SAM-dependent methyltransferase [Planctomycetota bacterium]
MPASNSHEDPSPERAPARAPDGAAAPDRRARARALREEAADSGVPDRWCEDLYREAASTPEVVFWADRVPNPNLTARWGNWSGDLPDHPEILVTGAGYGDDAAWLANQGAQVTAFDVSPSAVAAAAERFSDRPIRWLAGDLFAPGIQRASGFQLVVEIYTLQVLHPDRRAAALAPLASLVAPGGELWIIARGRDDGDEPGALPWPLLRAELAPLTALGLVEHSFEDYLDDETPPLRRFVARYRRPVARD